jgi:hypothetical protein
MSGSRRGIALLLALLAPVLVHAQACPGCAAEDTTAHGHVWPALGIHLGAPQKASAALGVVIGETWRRAGHEHARNVALFAEPGLASGRASLAYVDHGFGSFGSGFGVAATFLRTWSDPWIARENTSYIGADLIVWPIVFTGPRIGIFHSVNGSPGSRKWFVGIDLGVGL